MGTGAGVGGEAGTDEPGGVAAREVFRSDASVFSAAGDRSQIDALFPCQAPDRRAGGNWVRGGRARPSGLGRQRGGRNRLGAPHFLNGNAERHYRRGGRSCLCRRFGCFTAGDGEDGLAHLDRIALSYKQFCNAATWGQGISTTALSVSSWTTPSLAAITSPSWTSTLQRRHLDILAQFGKLEVDVH